MSRRFRTNADVVDKEDDNADDDEVVEEGEKQNFKRRRGPRLLLGGFDYEKGLKKTKQVVISPVRNFRKLFQKQNRSSSSSPSASNLSSNATRIGNFVCCLCLSKPQTSDKSPDGIDPNDPTDSYESIKSLIEKSDFYSKDCNTHFGD